tara:strand:- start:23423 stop:23872 length:450 start_codon:yes stop_codon:yes gene_type:complete
MTSTSEAVDALFGAVVTAWGLSASATGLPLEYADVKADPAGESVDGNNRTLGYGRVTLNHTAGLQGTMGNVGNRQFSSNGIFTIQIFTPAGDGYTLGRAIGSDMITALRALRSPNGVSLNNISPPLESGITGAYSMILITADVSYRERA